MSNYNTNRVTNFDSKMMIRKLKCSYMMKQLETTSKDQLNFHNTYMSSETTDVERLKMFREIKKQYDEFKAISV